jgi:predicted permease
MARCRPPSPAYALARQLGSDAELMAIIITAQTVAAIVTMPITLQLAMSLFG